MTACLLLIDWDFDWYLEFISLVLVRFEKPRTTVILVVNMGALMMCNVSKCALVGKLRKQC